MNQQMFADYAALREQKEKLEEEIATLGVSLMASLQAENIDSVQNDYGTFSLITVPRWKYSEMIQTQEEAIKGLKESERESGTATMQATTSLRFQKIK